MSFLTFVELWGAYCTVAVILSLAVLTVWIQLHGVPPLLDGSLLGSALDDSDRRRHIADAALEEDREVEALDALFALPARRHP